MLRTRLHNGAAVVTGMNGDVIGCGVTPNPIPEPQTYVIQLTGLLEILVTGFQKIKNREINTPVFLDTSPLYRRVFLLSRLNKCRVLIND